MQKFGYVINNNLLSVNENIREKIPKNSPQSLHIKDKELSSIAPTAFKSLTIIELIIEFKNTNLNLEKESFSGLLFLQSLQILSGIL